MSETNEIVKSVENEKLVGERVLTVDNLEVSFHTYAGEVRAVRDISFHVNQGETLAFVGESGCGKTVKIGRAHV